MQRGRGRRAAWSAAAGLRTFFSASAGRALSAAPSTTPPASVPLKTGAVANLRSAVENMAVNPEQARSHTLAPAQSQRQPPPPLPQRRYPPARSAPSPHAPFSSAGMYSFSIFEPSVLGNSTISQCPVTGSINSARPQRGAPGIALVSEECRCERTPPFGWIRFFEEQSQYWHW
eukprot:COSAG02_NODE_9880_length_2084_cov_3.531990_3_plen_174_part_00